MRDRRESVGRAPPLVLSASPRPTTPPTPANAAKLDAADAPGAPAADAKLTLIQMAVAFVVRHPAVTSAIIGPRIVEHLEGYLAADGIELSADVLDRIDEIVPPESLSTWPTTCGTSTRRRTMRPS